MEEYLHRRVSFDCDGWRIGSMVNLNEQVRQVIIAHHVDVGTYKLKTKFIFAYFIILHTSVNIM